MYPKLARNLQSTDDLKCLADRGMLVETNDEGEITKLQLIGVSFNDRILSKLACCKAISIIDIRETSKRCSASRRTDDKQDRKG